MKIQSIFPTLFFLGVLLVACRSESQSLVSNQSNLKADVSFVAVSGEDNHYQFSVTLTSPDTGCDQYADWWEVISESGDLLYRRILAHSHVTEQPFTRSGGEVKVLKNQRVWIRAHMNNTGYGGKTMSGTVASGFKEELMPAGFALDLETQNPLPSDCSF